MLEPGVELSEVEEVRNDGHDSSRSSKADSWTAGMELTSHEEKYGCTLELSRVRRRML